MNPVESHASFLDGIKISPGDHPEPMVLRVLMAGDVGSMGGKPCISAINSSTWNKSFQLRSNL
jgi:hypothetical protein